MIPIHSPRTVLQKLQLTHTSESPCLYTGRIIPREQIGKPRLREGKGRARGHQQVVTEPGHCVQCSRYLCESHVHPQPFLRPPVVCLCPSRCGSGPLGSPGPGQAGARRWGPEAGADTLLLVLRLGHAQHIGAVPGGRCGCPAGCQSLQVPERPAPRGSPEVVVVPRRSTPNCAHPHTSGLAGRARPLPPGLGARLPPCPHSQGGTCGTRAAPRFALGRAELPAEPRPPTPHARARASPRPRRPARPGGAPLPPVAGPAGSAGPGVPPPSPKSTHRARKGRPGRRGPGGARSSWRAGRSGATTRRRGRFSGERAGGARAPHSPAEPGGRRL